MRIGLFLLCFLMTTHSYAATQYSIETSHNDEIICNKREKI